jgi:hypothetical protein
MTEAQKKQLIKVGQVVQINPECKVNPMFGGCMMIVTELKGWGVMGFVQALGEDMKVGGRAYIRLKWEEIEWVGTAPWVPADEIEGE